jgi:chromosomal replication initiation ATPase DnaA
MKPNKYKQFVFEGLNKPVNLFNDLYAGFILGGERFIRKTLDMIKDKVEGEDFSHEKIITGQEPDEIIEAVCKHYKKEPEALLKARKKPVFAKKVAVYLLKTRTSLTNKDIGQRFGIGYTGVSWIVAEMGKLLKGDSRLSKEIECII